MENNHISVKEARKISSTIGFGLFFMALANLGTQFALLYGFDELIENMGVLRFTLLANGIGMYIIGMSVFKFITRKLESAKSKFPEKYDFLDIMELCILAILAMYVFNMIGLGITALLGIDVINPVDTLVKETAGGDIVFLVLSTCILAPIFEELLFRKWILGNLRILGNKKAVFISSILFAFFHMNISQGVYAFGIGLILAYAAVKSGSIKVPIIIHMVVNFVGGALMPTLLGIFPEISIPYGETIVVALVLWFFVCGGIVFFTKRKHLLNSENLLESGAVEAFTFPTIYLNFGMIVFFSFCIFMSLDYLI